MISQKDRWRRCQLALDEQKELSERDRRLNVALSALYESGSEKRRGGLGSAPRVAKWLGDIREFFPTSVVQIVQKDAFERLNLKALMLEPKFLSTLEADVHLVADLISLRAAIPGKTLETARQVVRKVVDDLMRRLEHNTRETLRGALNRSQRTRRPRHTDIDWPRTINANLRHYQPEHRTVVPETLVGHTRHTKSRAQLDHIILCVDQSGSMATSVVYSSIFAAVMASVPGLSTKLMCFDTAIVDLTPVYEAKHAEAIASLGCPVFACTPDQFPSLVASAITGKDLQNWAAEEDVALIRGF